MTTRGNSSAHTTSLRTLWSETLFEMLYDAVKHNWSRNALLEIMSELRRKGYKPDRVLKKIERKFGADAAMKVRLMIRR